MIEIINQQRKIKINAPDFVEFAEKVLAVVEEANGKTAAIAFVSDAKMRKLNREYRGKDATTDVLSFQNEADADFADFGDAANSLGEIAISVEQAQRQAAENNLTLELEIKQLILHGVLHLCGYDHEDDNGKMNALELRLRDNIGI